MASRRRERPNHWSLPRLARYPDALLQCLGVEEDKMCALGARNGAHSLPGLANEGECGQAALSDAERKGFSPLGLHHLLHNDAEDLGREVIPILQERRCELEEVAMQKVGMQDFANQGKNPGSNQRSLLCKPWLMVPFLL